MKNKGKIKWFNMEKGFGYITGQNGKDYFLHKSECTSPQSLKENDAVEFNVCIVPKGDKAINVSKLPKSLQVAPQQPIILKSADINSPEQTDSEQYSEHKSETKQNTLGIKRVIKADPLSLAVGFIGGSLIQICAFLSFSN